MICASFHSQKEKSQYENNITISIRESQHLFSQIAKCMLILKSKGVTIMSNRIRELRNEQNLTLKELGEKVGLAPNTISQYETGDREPKLKTWIKLADFFDVPVSYLQGLDDSRDVNQISFFKISSYDDALEKCLSKKERDELSDIENKIIKVYISRKMDFNTRDELKYDLEKIIEKYIDKTDVKSTDLENFASNLKENYNQDKQ